MRGRQAVGRILAFTEHPTARHRGRDVGFFGYFDCLDDAGAAQALVAHARRWLETEGCSHLEGPIDLRPALGGGVLVEGFARPPVVGAAHNGPHVARLLTGSGLTPLRELHSWVWSLAAGDEGTERLLARADRDLARGHVTLRHADLRCLDEELADWHYLFNASRQDRSGHVPLSRKVFDAIAYDLARVALDELLLFAVVDGRPVGVAVTLPDVNPILPSNGRLFPLAWLRLHQRRSRVRQARLQWIDVLPEYRLQGIEALLLAGTARAAQDMGLDAIEICWTDEHDHALNHEIRQVGARLERRARIYEGAVSG